jgi:integrase
MARRRSPLTQETVDRLRATTAKDAFLWDGALPGFGVRARPGGSKRYLLKYRSLSGDPRWYTIGDCSAIPLADRKGADGRIIETGARTRARQALGAVAEGKDPAAAREAAAEMPTVGEVAHQWLVWGETRAIRAWKAKTLYEYMRIVKGSLKPTFGRYRLNELKVPKIDQFQKSHANRPYEANRVLGALKQVYGYAQSKLGYTGPNPVADIEFYSEEARTCPLEDADILKLRDALKANENRFPSAVLAVRLMMLSGARRNEIIRARWDWVNWDHGEIRIPDHKSRRNGDKKAPKVIVIGPVGLHLLRPLTQKRGPIFPAEDGAQKSECYAGIGKAWSAIRAAAKVTGPDGRPLRLHDLRHAYGATAVDAGVPDNQIGEQFGHADRRSTERYTKARNSTKRRVGTALSAAIGAALGIVVDAPSQGE